MQVEPGHCPEAQQSQLQLQFMFFSLIELVWSENAIAVYSDGEPPSDPFRVALAALVRFERFRVVVQNGFKCGLCARLDAVVDPLVPLCGGEDSRLTEGLQMVGER